LKSNVQYAFLFLTFIDSSTSQNYEAGTLNGCYDAQLWTIGDGAIAIQLPSATTEPTEILSQA
jgi:hypothetical protein